MSFNRLPTLEAQPTQYRDEPETQDDPEFDKFSEDLSTKLFSLTANIARLSQQVNLLGTKRDTERVRERVHDLLDESREGFQEVGDGIKRLAAWEDLSASQKYTQQKLSR
jgi:syntaxin 7